VLSRAFMAGILVMTLVRPAAAAERLMAVDPDKDHVAVWNRFADNVYALHRRGLVGRQVRETVTTGEYNGMAAEGQFYRDVTYTDARTGQLLSRVRTDRDHPETRQIIEAYVWGQDGRVARDYIAMYLPWAHNAPINTFITLHRYHDGLHAMRQFNASGERIYEQCNGTLAGTRIDIGLDWGEISPQATSSPTYRECFDGLQETAGIYLTPQ